MINKLDLKRGILMDLVCSQQSQKIGDMIILETYQGRPLLTGKIGEEFLVLFLSQDPVPGAGPLSALQTKLSIPPHGDCKFRWIFTLADSKTRSLEKLDQAIQMDWPGEIARRRIEGQGLMEIKTGDPEWDFALAFSQKQAVFISRQITSGGKQGKSPGPDLSPLQALHLLRSIQPLEQGLVRDILRVVFKPGSENGRTQMNSGQTLSPPTLAAELLWQVMNQGFDSKTWSAYLPAAAEGLESWFSSDLDEDCDGVPELANPLIFNLMDPVQDMSPGADRLIPYPYLESPGLGALLFNDLSKLKDLAGISGTSVDINIEQKIECLRNYLLDSWNSETGCFQTRDSRSHVVTDGFNIDENIRPGLNMLRMVFPQPSRVIVLRQNRSADQTPGEFNLTLHGRDLRGYSRVEAIHSRDLSWQDDIFWGITKSVYSNLDFCTLDGLIQPDQLRLVAPSTSDKAIPSILPLWAEILPENQAQSSIQNLLLNPGQYWSPFGFRTRAESPGSSVQLIWNVFPGLALLRYGKLDQAAELIRRWMAALIPSVIGSGKMYPAYHAASGKGLGQEDSLESLFPVSYFLQVLGIQFYQDRSMVVTCQNPFPWPVRLNYRGVMIECGKDQTTISRHGQEPIILAGGESCLLDLV